MQVDRVRVWQGLIVAGSVAIIASAVSTHCEKQDVIVVPTPVPVTLTWTPKTVVTGTPVIIPTQTLEPTPTVGIIVTPTTDPDEPPPAMRGRG